MPYKNYSDKLENERFKRRLRKANEWARLGFEVLNPSGSELYLIRCTFCGKETGRSTISSRRHHPGCVNA